MARDTLDTLLRLRRLEVQEQMRALAAALRAEEQACLARDAGAEAIAREVAEARTIAARDAALPGFVPWRARAAQALCDAEALAAASVDATRAARAVLGQARGALRGVELAIERRQTEANLASQRTAQHALDDASRRSAAHDR